MNTVSVYRLWMGEYCKCACLGCGWVNTVSVYRLWMGEYCGLFKTVSV